MTCDKCNGTGWLIVEHNGFECASMCNCRAKAQQPHGKLLTEDMAGGLVAGMCQILAFAPAEVGQGIIVAALMEMCSTQAQATYVVNRACALHTKWETCGIRGLRQILCAVYVPADGVMVSATEAYPDGIPSIRPPESVFPKLPPGRVASADVGCERAILALGEAKAIDGDRKRPVPQIAEQQRKKGGS